MLYTEALSIINNPLNGMRYYEAIAKSVIKAMSHNDYSFATCQSIIQSNWKDVIFDDVVQTIAETIIINCDDSNTEFDTKKDRLQFNDFTVNDKVTNIFFICCTNVYKLFDTVKNPKIELVNDTICNSDNEEETANTNNLSKYIDIATNNTNPDMDKVENEVIDFLKWVHAKKIAKNTETELIDFIYWLMNGDKINTIAERMKIKESKAYYLRKRVHDLYMQYNPIKRKIIYFAKVDCTVKKWVTIGNNDKHIDCESWTYKRVYPKDATITIAGKTTKTIAYVDSKNNTIIPIEGTKIKSYVVNMSKKALFADTCGIKNRIPKHYTSNGFSYSSVGSIPTWIYETAGLMDYHKFIYKDDYIGKLDYNIIPYVPEQNKKTEKLTEARLNEKYPFTVWNEQMKKICDKWVKKYR